MLSPPGGGATSRSRTPLDLAGRCPACWLRLGSCLCGELPRVVPRTGLLVIRHVREAFHSTNSARIAALALPELRLLPYGERDVELDPAPLTQPGTFLLFPGSPPPEAGPPPQRLVILDGSWQQVRRMVRSVPALQALPRFSLPAEPVAPGLRRQQTPEGRSTLQAIAAALRLLEGEAVAAPLDALHELLVARVLSARGRRAPVGAPG